MSDVSKVFAEIIRNSEVRMQDIRRLSELGVPAMSIALTLVDSDKFLEKLNNWCNENRR